MVRPLGLAEIDGPGLSGDIAYDLAKSMSTSALYFSISYGLKLFWKISIEIARRTL